MRAAPLLAKLGLAAVLAALLCGAAPVVPQPHCGVAVSPQRGAEGVGVHVMRGANSGSADCDIRDVNMTGNNESDSIGLLIEAHDSTLTNIRCVDFATGVRMRGAGFRNNQATNAVLLVGEPGGHGVIRDIRLVEERLNSSDDAFRDYFHGAMHK